LKNPVLPAFLLARVVGSSSCEELGAEVHENRLKDLKLYEYNIPKIKAGLGRKGEHLSL
jgi:hypothetical protein